MFHNITNALPLILTDEKVAMMRSIVNLLRQRGFIVIFKEQMNLDLQGTRESRFMDGLDLLRYVSQNWNKDIPVRIYTSSQYAGKLAA